MTDDWGFTKTADFLSPRIISLQYRLTGDGINKITWVLRVGPPARAYYYEQESSQDATQDMADAEQCLHEARMELMISDN